jgi:DNA-3-methyladenine glycosylase II
MSAYRDFLAKDVRGRKLLKYDVVLPTIKKDLLLSLISSILGQQLSIQVAAIMRTRFLDLYGGKAPKAQQILETPFETIRNIGISRSKTQYIINVAQYFSENKITYAKVSKMTDEEIIELLVPIKVVGRWTVEMILIFSLGREDVFALDDLGVQKAMIELFKLQDLPKKVLKKKMLELSKRWSPYRSYLCLHMWRYQG